MHTALGQCRFLLESSVAARALAGSRSVGLPGFTQQRTSRYDLIRTRVPMDERVREAWQSSYSSIEHAISVTHVLEDDLMLGPFEMTDSTKCRAIPVWTFRSTRTRSRKS